MSRTRRYWSQAFIAILPDELLINIFHLSQVPIQTLSSVCQRWRNASLSCPLLWCNIYMHPLRPKSVKLGELYAYRSGNSLLSLTMTLTPSSSKTKSTLEDITEAREHLILLMLMLSPRIQTLCIAKHLLSILFPYPHLLHFTSLKSLDIQIVSDPSIGNNPLPELFPFALNAPGLRELGIWNRPILLPTALLSPSLPFSNISTVRLMKCTVRTVFMVLLGCAQVREVELANIEFFSGSNDIADVDWNMFGLLDGVLYSSSVQKLVLDVSPQILEILTAHTQFPNLHFLHVQSSSAFLSSTAEWKNVRTVSLGGATVKWNAGWPWAVQNVREVVLSGVKKMSGRMVKAMVDVLPAEVQVVRGAEGAVLWHR